MITAQTLIGKGYFPGELIPPFNTDKFSNSLAPLRIGSARYNTGKSKSCIHSIPKVKHQRRQVSIPNPLHQLMLSKVVEDKWTEFVTFFARSNLSVSTPVLTGDRALNRNVKFADLTEKRAILSNDSRYVLRTDISRFFPTIYTHSIPWAMHTKEVAKANRGNGLTGNLLDTRVRNTQDQQTLGIPLGPDTSRLISEIIGTSIDEQLLNGNSLIKGFRYVDDYFLYFKTLSQAELALSQMHKVMSDFMLELNPSKTVIVELPETLEATWVSDLRLLRLRAEPRKQKTDLLTYFSKAFQYSKQYSNDYVLKYALSAIKELKIHEDNWEIYEALILNSIIAEPSVLPSATEILQAYHVAGYPLNMRKILETISEIILHHSQFGHGYEVAWALWLCKTLNINLPREVANQISTFDDCIVALVSLDLHQRGLIPTGLDTTLWRSYMADQELYSEHWLLAYEAKIKGWLPSVNGNNYTASDDFFSILENSRVEFYDPDRQVVSIALREIETVTVQAANFGY